ncbi:hypothetical protein FACS1894124_1850 [Spirochaetia bacterium]|nr:hypothetical protein FACS1894124_1850 [Spirochaetia bacterium]
MVKKLIAVFMVLAALAFIAGCREVFDPGNQIDPEVQEQANEFVWDYEEILDKAVGDVRLADEAALNRALSAFNDLEETVQKALAAQKALLEQLKTEIDALKADASPADLADAFKEGHKTILAKTTATVKDDDEPALLAALADYDALAANVQSQLTSQKTRLDGLQAKINAGNINYNDTTPSITVEAVFDVSSFTSPIVSKGASTTGTTYYIDAAYGDDDKDGKSPANAWKSFINVNKAGTPIAAGDHILLEQDSIWNGTSVSNTNFLPSHANPVLVASDKVAMIAPPVYLSGTAENPIVVDIYKNSGGTAVFNCDKRPILNGNGTPARDPSTNPWQKSGVVDMQGSSYWEVYNLEITNTFETNITTNPNHWMQRDVRKNLAGISIERKDALTYPAGNTVKYCYVHDVQSLNNYNAGQKPSSYTWTGTSVEQAASKITGGIFVGHKDVVIEGNIVKKVNMEGIRNNGGSATGGNATSADTEANTNIIIRGNYVETVGGDGIVLGGCKYGLVESNIVKDACASTNASTTNWAGNWCFVAGDSLYQYNEGYGTLYGYQDGEAFDFDLGCPRVIYQYNFSHHNAGGAVLIMGTSDAVYRYNISANDGASTRYMATIAGGPGANEVSTSVPSYTAWTGGQTVFHYTNSGTSASANIPLIYNNTIWIGPGITNGLFGHNGGEQNKYVRFYNNIVVKAGEGTLHLSYGHQGGGNGNGHIVNPAGFKNNLLWGYKTNPKLGDRTKIQNGSGESIQTLTNSTYGNFWADPKLKIEIAGNQTALRAMRDTKFPDIAPVNIKDALAAFTSKERLRTRASIFTPIDATSPVIGKGMDVPVKTTRASLDNAWNGGKLTVGTGWDESPLTEDFFGVKITGKPPIGASVGPYTP